MSNVINKTLKRGGKILFPVLGVGRAQEVTLIIEELSRLGKIPKVPVFIDGMVWDITAITTTYPEFLSKNVRKLVFQEDHNPFHSEIFNKVGSQKERMKVIEETGPCIILATSGMLVGGPSLEYFKHLADNPKNTVMFVAYQGEGSHGREVQNGAEKITIEDSKGGQETIRIKLEVHTIKELSGHLDRNEINRFLRKVTPKPKRIIFNHGEKSKCISLASDFHRNMRVETLAPRPLDVIRLR
jgi:predicted metal-dependent RNase